LIKSEELIGAIEHTTL